MPTVRRAATLVGVAGLLAVVGSGASALGASAAGVPAGLAEEGVNASTYAQAQAEVSAAQQEPGALAALVAQATTPTQIGLFGRPLVGPTAIQAALAAILYQDGATQVNPSIPANPPLAVTATTNSVFNSNPCWGPHDTEATHTIAGGAVVVEMKITNPEWCGNGSTLSYGVHNWTPYAWTNWPYCGQPNGGSGSINFNNGSAAWDQGSDGSSGGWAHARLAATIGEYPLGIPIGSVCVTILGSVNDYMRVAANGYWDGYDDWGD